MDNNCIDANQTETALLSIPVMSAAAIMINNQYFINSEYISAAVLHQLCYLFSASVIACCCDNVEEWISSAAARGIYSYNIDRIVEKAMKIR